LFDRARLAKNLAAIRDRMDAAAGRSGRDPNSVQLVAVTKYVGAEIVSGLYDLGLRDFGESRPQVIWEKSPALPDDVRWHMIGHWQTNKVRRTIPLVGLVHSLDRWPLAEEISRECQRQGRELPCLVEVKLVDDAAKHGFAAEELRSMLPAISRLPGVRVKGLMAMASFDEDAQTARPIFRELARLRGGLADELGIDLPFLSMGMSQDFEVAIEEGATHIRVGSILFEGVVDA
jgi:pyridoxal phosphate enzyme (YggS family)